MADDELGDFLKLEARCPISGQEVTRLVSERRSAPPSSAQDPAQDPTPETAPIAGTDLRSATDPMADFLYAEYEREAALVRGSDAAKQAETPLVPVLATPEAPPAPSRASEASPDPTADAKLRRWITWRIWRDVQQAVSPYWTRTEQQTKHHAWLERRLDLSRQLFTLTLPQNDALADDRLLLQAIEFLTGDRS